MSAIFEKSEGKFEEKLKKRASGKNNSTKDKLTIAEAATIIGVSTQTLRNWEEAKIISPESITKGGHRRYTIEQVEQLKQTYSNAEAINFKQLQANKLLDFFQSALSLFGEENVDIKINSDANAVLKFDVMSNTCALSKSFNLEQEQPSK